VALVCSSSTASIRSGEVGGVGEDLRDVAFSFPFDVGSCSVDRPTEVVVLDSGVCQVCSVGVDSYDQFMGPR
jgi:predicted component of type VI protein secretion system